MTKVHLQLSSYCGLECLTCPIHLATIEKDPDEQVKMRLEIAEECSRLYGKNFTPEDIGDCDGCKENKGRLFAGCRNCKIRECAIRRNIPNCAYCNDFACDELLKLFSLDPEAKIRLENIRNNIF
jgi:hypothetical protein